MCCWGVFALGVGDGELGAVGGLFTESYLFVPGATVLVWIAGTVEAWAREDTTSALLVAETRRSR